MKPILVIINADDVGASSSINADTARLMSEGLITSGTILTNGQKVEEAFDLVERYPQCSFGVHLNLTAYIPLTGDKRLRQIMTETGEFRLGGIRQATPSRSLAEGIFREWTSQVSKAIKAGLKPSHLDSHHHVHTIPWLFPILKAVQREFGIRKVRISKNLYSPPKSKLSMMGKRVWNTALRNIYETKTTDAFTSFREFRELWETGRATKFIENRMSETRIIELMVHPANPEFHEENDLLSKWWGHSELLNKRSYLDNW